MKPRVVIFSARGELTFTPRQRQQLGSAADVCFVAAPEKVSRTRFIELAADADLAGLSPRATPALDSALLAELPRLRKVVLPTTGVEWLSVDLLRESGIEVKNLPDYSTASTAEFTWGLVLAATRHLCEAHFDWREGRKTSAFVGTELEGKTLGVVGYGAVGKRVARFGAAFGMKVLAHDKVPFQSTIATACQLDDLLSRADIVVLHVPLTSETKALFREARLRRMKPGAFLVNTARPALVDFSTITTLLDEGHLKRYAFDTGYFPAEDLREIARHPKVLAVPHISWLTTEAMEREIELWTASLLSSIETWVYDWNAFPHDRDDAARGRSDSARSVPAPENDAV